MLRWLQTWRRPRTVTPERPYNGWHDAATGVDIIKYGTNFIVRTPNATVAIAVEHDRDGHDLTAISLVSDAPYTLVSDATGYDDAMYVFTRHPAASAGMSRSSSERATTSHDDTDTNA